MEEREKNNLIKTCVQCGKEFKVRSPSEIFTRVNCSKKCQVESTRKKKTKINCLICKKEMYVLPCLLETTKCCSRKCKGINERKIKEENLRQCNKCNKIKSLCSFTKNDYICKPCRANMAKERRETPRGRFVSAYNIATRRNMEWTIDENVYEKLMKQKCHYCNCSLNPTGTGLDRKDNKKGYTEENVVPCCSSCNITRSDNYSYEEMIILAETIKEIKARRS